MKIETLLNDKGIKTKGKVEAISKALLDEKIKIDDVIKAAGKLSGAEKGTCVESLEFATRSRPELAGQKCLTFAVDCLQDKAPRVRWESAKVIANIAHLFTTKLDGAISGLLINTEFPGTVVRWSAAHALSNIIALKTKHTTGLIPVIEAILKREENAGIRKIYMAGLKKVEKN